MHILSINCGSSTLKWDVWRLEKEEVRLAGGSVERIGQAEAPEDHSEAAASVLEALAHREDDLLNAIDAVGHRVVHGGSFFQAPVIITDEVVERIQRASALAPLHNGPALEAVRACRDAVGVPMVATFDTAFFADLPERAARYAIDLELAERHAIRRYGFHGLAHSWMASALADREGRTGRFVTLQLGNGCSVAAIADGKPVDTSMGFTPLEGLVMGTRSGDLDPALVPYLARELSLTLDQVEDLLNRRSGLLGISGVASDMREVSRAADEGNQRAALAIDIFCYRVQKYVGAYASVLGGVEAIAFGGGIGENNATIRERIIGPLKWLGVELDAERNANLGPGGGLITHEGSRVRVYVVSIDESLLIARDTRECLRARRQEGGE